MKNVELLGKRFGRLTVVAKVESLNYRSRFLCKCDCGNEKLVLGQNLLSGHVQSCGCLHSEKSKARIVEYNSAINREIHGETRTRLYRIWEGIKTRCFKQTHKSYKDYGARGVTMCDEWCNSFTAFRDWSLANGYNDKLSIDRIDVDGDYSPQNCRWVAPSVQASNKRILSRNTTGYTGVSYNKASGKFVAYITRNYKMIHLGVFDTVEAAADARHRAEQLIDR